MKMRVRDDEKAVELVCEDADEEALLNMMILSKMRFSYWFVPDTEENPSAGPEETGITFEARRSMADVHKDIETEELNQMWGGKAPIYAMWVSVAEVARLTGLSEDTIRRKCETNELWNTRLGGEYVVAINSETKKIWSSTDQCQADEEATNA